MEVGLHMLQSPRRPPDVLTMHSHVTGVSPHCRTQGAISGFLIKDTAPHACMPYTQPYDSPWDKDLESHNPGGSPSYLLAHKAVYGDPERKQHVMPEAD